MTVMIGRIFGLLGVYARGTRGAAAAEFALVLTLLSIPVLNVVDLGMYAYQRMELQNGAQMGAQAAIAMAPNCTLPLTTGSCSGSYASTIAAAAHSTSLGTQVTVTSTTEEYWCVNPSTNQLQQVGTAASPPSPFNCTAAGNTTDPTPGDYIRVTASYSYAPVFTGVSVASLLTTPITDTVWMRLQ
jgi:Flp pilus assembly protein TadG